MIFNAVPFFIAFFVYFFLAFFYSPYIIQNNTCRWGMFCLTIFSEQIAVKAWFIHLRRE